MQIHERIRKNIVTVDPNGRLTVETEASFSDAMDGLFERGRTQCILNLDQVNYIDSTGLGAMIRAYLSAWRRGGRLVLVNVRGKNRELLSVTKLLTVFDVYNTETEAERSFERSPEIARRVTSELMRPWAAG
jgi:anti-sigma B factor antagonist